MVCDNGGGLWNFGDTIVFGIRAAAGWHGGEIVVLPFGAAPAFLFHGGHLWDDVAGDEPNVHFGLPGFDEVDGIEATPNKDDLFGARKLGNARTLETPDGCMDADGKYKADGSVCPGGAQGAADPAVPAVTEWGLVVMVPLVLAAGTVVLRRWRRLAAKP